MNGNINCTNDNCCGSECTFTCDEGYQLLGEKVHTCGVGGNDIDDSGVWSHSEVPICQGDTLGNHVYNLAITKAVKNYRAMN